MINKTRECTLSQAVEAIKMLKPIQCEYTTDGMFAHTGPKCADSLTIKKATYTYKLLSMGSMKPGRHYHSTEVEVWDESAVRHTYRLKGRGVHPVIKHTGLRYSPIDGNYLGTIRPRTGAPIINYGTSDGWRHAYLFNTLEDMILFINYKDLKRE